MNQASCQPRRHMRPERSCRARQPSADEMIEQVDAPVEHLELVWDRAALARG